MVEMKTWFICMTRRIEKQMQYVFIEHLSIRRITLIQLVERIEIMREDINALGIDKTCILLHHQVDALDSLTLVANKLINEHDDIFNICETFILVCLVHAITHKHQQRIFYSERSQLPAIFQEAFLLLIGTEKATGQVKQTGILTDIGILQVIDTIILTIAIIIEVLIGVIEEDCLLIVLHDIPVFLFSLLACQSLFKCSRVLKGKAILSHFLTVANPFFSTYQTTMAFIHQQQIIGFKTIHADRLVLADIIKLIYINNQYFIAIKF